MRLIHTFDDQKLALQFSNFLNKEGIENQCEIIANTDWGSSDYGTFKCHLWVIDEDDLEMTQRWLDEYLQNPASSIFLEQEKWKAPLAESLQTLKEVPQKLSQARQIAMPIEKKGLGFVTLYLFISCVVLFIYAQFSSPQVERFYPSFPMIPFEFPTIYKQLMFDYPKAYEILDKLINAYGVDKFQNLAELPQEGRLLLEQYTQTPFWEGIYDKVVLYLKSPQRPWSFNAPLFEKIQDGEIWRIFTPILLHGNVVHLFL